MRKIFFALFALILPTAAFASSRTSTLASPDGNLEVLIQSGSKVTYSVNYKGNTILSPSEISMTLSDGTVIGSKRAIIHTGKVNNKDIKPDIYFKNNVDDVYNYITLDFKGFSLEFRAYNDGVAYRFVSTSRKGDFNVASEKAEFNFAQDWPVWIPFVGGNNNSFKDQFHNSFESYYDHLSLSQIDPKRLAFPPLVIEASNDVKVLVTDADVYDYPGMFINGGNGTTLKAVFPPYPKSEESFDKNPHEAMVTEAEDYIAKAHAGQAFPWRVMNIVPDVKDLAGTDMAWRLARPAAEGSDFSWVRPGKAVWDWWYARNISGVDFKSGINTETYKYLVDFAAANGSEYVLIDSGWAVNGDKEANKVIPEVDLPEIVKYARGKNVGIMLWTCYNALRKDIEGPFKHFSEMGIKGFKIDFMDRQDQKIIEFCENVAKEAEKYHLVIDFHGVFKPTGLQRAYPNILNYEGVRGLENAKWGGIIDNPMAEDDVIIPFIRMAAGSMDYTPGAMINASKDNYRPIRQQPMSQGTRCHQLAEYVVFYEPLAMISDSPSNYQKEKESLEFINSCPTVWDETIPICGMIGEYVAIARRKGNVWFVGAMTNWDARDLTLDLSFIGSGTVTALQDGMNADKVARDYKKITFQMPSDGKIKIHMASGGGWAAIIK